jgi:Zn-dependent M32 family carboxypeptidase
MYRFNKILEAKKKGFAIMQNLEAEKEKINKLLRTYQPYDEQKMYERIFDSLTRGIDDIRRSLL